MEELLEEWLFEWKDHGASIDGGGNFVRSTQKQPDSSRLTATNKNPRNLFGLESNELAKKDALALPPY